mgnify:CR=1 FL=1
MQAQSTIETNTISTLNRLLRGERSAVATYIQAQEHLKGQYAADIEANRACHQGRVDALIDRISDLGGQPSTEGGAWVGFTKVVENAASLLGTGAVIAALEQGEDIGLDSYRTPMTELDQVSRQMIDSDILPAQERTHHRMSMIKKSR